MNSRPKLRKGARLCIQNFHSILFFEILLATALWSAPEFSNDHASTATNDCSPDITCLENFTSQQYPVDEDGDGYDDAAVSTVRVSDLLSDASSDCSDELRFSIYFRYQIEQGEVTPQSDDPDSLVLNCPNYCGWYMVRVYVWDDNFNPDSVQPDGTVGGPNYSYCDIPVLAQDVISVCNCDFLSIYCLVKTKEGTPLKGVSVDLDGEDFDLNGTTNVQGGCYFGYSAFGLVTPRLNTQALNGVSTVDIILIRRHILGIQLLNSPYKRIAADVNNDKTITTTDPVMLRRLILGIDSTFTDNTSWRFVRANYYFPVPTNPWFEDFPETINVNSHEQYNGFTYHAEFIGIKIGDVNASADTDLFQPENDGAQGSRSTLPERLIQPYLQPAPEYGANVKAVTDTCAPVITCIGGIAIDLFPVDTLIDIDGDGDLDAGSMQVWGGDFVLNVSTDCGNSVKVSIYKTADIESGDVIPDSDDGGSWIFTCNDLGLVPVRIYVWDDDFTPDAVQPDGTVGGPNYSYCEATVLVQDNQFNVCSPDNTSLSGVITTETNIGVGGISVGLSGPISMMTQTDVGGGYAFPSSLPPSPLVPYVITPDGGTYYLNGVSAMDYILIHRHILGIQPLNSPYKLIAADINNDGKITNLDLIHFRRLILQLDNGFIANSSWRFVRADYVFPDPTDPWLEDFPESISTEEGSAFPALNFIAIKIGDVNNSAQ